ncbi:epoxide hydrolase, soluble (sEH) [Dimargaris xerosporica]|nr:epoxide hydrolase, soluble (sEH) [Dimargaris xerosporica]
MSQLVQFDPKHTDLIADVSFDLYGQRLCTVGSDHIVKIWQLNGDKNQWQLTSSWKGHDSSVTKVSWAHPEFGNLIATGSFDRTVKVWQESREDVPQSGLGGAALEADANINPWLLVVSKKDAQGMIVDLEFAPHYVGLQLAVASSDGVIRIYETGSPVKFDTWTLVSEIDINSPPVFAPYLADAKSKAAAPLDLYATTAMASANSICLSWCPSRFLPNMMVVGCGRDKDAKIYRYVGGRWMVYEVLGNHEDIIHNVSWAPQVGRSYHLIATACKDHYVRIYRVDYSFGAIDLGDSKDLEEEYESASASLKLKATLIASFEDHHSEVWSVSWNVTGTILSSSGDDGRVRLWKATSTGEWRETETISTDQDPE